MLLLSGAMDVLKGKEAEGGEGGGNLGHNCLDAVVAAQYNDDQVTAVNEFREAQNAFDYITRLEHQRRAPTLLTECEVMELERLAVLAAACEFVAATRDPLYYHAAEQLKTIRPMVRNMRPRRDVLQFMQLNKVCVCVCVCVCVLFVTAPQ